MSGIVICGMYTPNYHLITLKNGIKVSVPFAYNQLTITHFTSVYDTKLKEEGTNGEWLKGYK